MVISYEEALKIASKFAKEVEERFPGKIEAVLAIGSLGSDYYRPGQSDIDTAVITRYTRSEIEEVTNIIEKIADRYWKEYEVPKEFGACVFAKEQLYPPYVKNEKLIQKILRLKYQSKLIYGSFAVEDIPMPDKKAIKDDILNFQEWSDSQPPMVHTKKTMVNSTLMGLKRYLLLAHDIIEFNKLKVIDLYLRNDPPMVNEEVFDFITRYLYDQPYEWNDEIRERFTKWHDELFRVINEKVLYNEA